MGKKPAAQGFDPARRPSAKAGAANLHDVYLTVSLLHRTMLTTPPSGADPLHWHMSDRARFERLWVDKLFVLYEAWTSRKNPDVVAMHAELEASGFDLEPLRQAIAAAEAAGLVETMRETRHYMSHRDQRDYWDPGRMGPIGNLSALLALTDAFGPVLLFAIDHLHVPVRRP